MNQNEDNRRVLVFCKQSKRQTQAYLNMKLNSPGTKDLHLKTKDQNTKQDTEKSAATCKTEIKLSQQL